MRTECLLCLSDCKLCFVSSALRGSACCRSSRNSSCSSISYSSCCPHSLQRYDTHTNTLAGLQLITAFTAITNKDSEIQFSCGQWPKSPNILTLLFFFSSLFLLPVTLLITFTDSVPSLSLHLIFFFLLCEIFTLSSFFHLHFLTHSLLSFPLLISSSLHLPRSSSRCCSTI